MGARGGGGEEESLFCGDGDSGWKGGQLLETDVVTAAHIRDVFDATDFCTYKGLRWHILLCVFYQNI